MAKKNSSVDAPSGDYYELLEVSPRARPEVITAAYRALMKIYDPSKCSDDRVAKQLNAAHEVVSDATKRARYDENREQLAGKVVGNYRVLELIAEGGFGKTYKGEHLIAGEPVCLKHCSQISALDEQILVEEAKAVWDLRHFAIPAMRDLIRLADGSLALVMSYIPGKTLERIVEQVGRLEPEHVAWITERVLNVLRYLHFHGVVHGDIKPQNIIIQPDTHTVVLVDFGLSLVKPTSTSDAKGHTPYYAPPEQINGSPLVPESDFYSLGMTMIYALSGSAECVMRKDVPANVPEPMCEFLRRLIVRQVIARPQWERENLCETIQTVRNQAFGRRSSEMKPIPGI